MKAPKEAKEARKTKRKNELVKESKKEIKKPMAKKIERKAINVIMTIRENKKEEHDVNMSFASDGMDNCANKIPKP